MAKGWKPAAILAGVVTVVGAGSLLAWQGDRAVPSAATAPAPTRSPSTPGIVPASEPIAMASTGATQVPDDPRHPTTSRAAESRADAPRSEPRAAWGPTPTVPASLDRPIGSYMPERSGIALDPDAFQNLRPGSRLSFWMPDGPPIVAVVTEVRETGDTIGVRADLEGLPDPFGMVLTRSGLTMFGSVTAPWGNYRVEGVGGVGALEKENPAALIDPAKADALDPRDEARGSGIPIPGEAL